MAPAKLIQLLRTGIAHHEARRFAEAEVVYAKARVAAPFNFDVFHLSGWLALQQGRLPDAVRYLERAAKLNPRSGLCALRLADALKKSGRLAEAGVAAGRAVELDPQNPDAHFCLGEVLAATEGFAKAVACFRRVTELQPQAADGWSNLGVSLAQSKARDEALECFDRALAIDPASQQALTGRALVLQQTHRPAEAVEAYGRVLALNPRHYEARSARLLSMHYLDGISREQLFAEHQAFGASLESAAAHSVWPKNPPDPDRRLRVAFLSPDFRAHSIAYFIDPLLTHLDREKFEIVLYHDHAQVDAMSERLRAHASVWRHFAGQPDRVVEAAIRADAPDILIDLAGHTGFNRLPLFAKRLAPVQISYLGYPDTTGVPAMDYRFVDAITDPPGEADAFATEKLVRFAPTAWAYAPPSDAPEVMPPPCAKGGPVTFGCFNNFAKVSDTTLRLWAGALQAVPDSRLLLKADGLETPALQTRLHGRLARAGIDLARVELLGRTPGLAAHLAQYHRVDIALDTFPYHGTTTTCDALWMGVPVVTLVGDRHMSRVGVSLLSSVGHSEWVASSASDLGRKVLKLAGDREHLARLRADLREEVCKSVLCGHAGQAERFGVSLQACWSDSFCEGKPPS